MSFFKDWLFNKLPNYYHINDTYKDANGKGLLQRYLANIGDDLDDNILPFIDNLLNIIDPTTQASTDFKYLNHVAYLLGSPPDIFLGNPNHYQQYAKLLGHIVSIYKIKGTKKSFELFFALLGYIIQVIEYEPNLGTKFDSGFKFDEGAKFDTECEPCSEYSILSQALLNSGPCGSSSNPSLDPNLFQLMVEVAKFLQPINVNLRTIITGGLVCEEVDYCFEEEVTFRLLDVGVFDNPAFLMDTTDTFDQSTVFSTTIVNED